MPNTKFANRVNPDEVAHYEPDLDVVVVLMFYVHGKHLRSSWDGQLASN